MHVCRGILNPKTHGSGGCLNVRQIAGGGEKLRITDGVPSQRRKRQSKGRRLVSHGVLAMIADRTNVNGESAGIRTQDPRLKSSLSSISIAA
ncbi:protein of unknown function [Nitrospira defluvii]|uniref:Uncharacterized protein n=1 Tax=Nitrospira defluvii TaxID=330214 RepID=D8PIY7_9BACT|nr:protein of unknown function [Nitrospira defluvii]